MKKKLFHHFILSLAVLLMAGQAAGQTAADPNGKDYPIGSYGPNGNTGPYLEGVRFGISLIPIDVSSSDQQHYNRIYLRILFFYDEVKKYKYNGEIYKPQQFLCMGGFRGSQKFKFQINISGVGSKTLVAEMQGNDYTLELPLNKIYTQDELNRVKVASFHLVEIYPDERDIQNIKDCLDRQQKEAGQKRQAEQKAQREKELQQPQEQQTTTTRQATGSSSSNAQSGDITADAGNEAARQAQADVSIQKAGQAMINGNYEEAQAYLSRARAQAAGDPAKVQRITATQNQLAKITPKTAANNSGVAYAEDVLNNRNTGDELGDNVAKVSVGVTALANGAMLSDQATSSLVNSAAGVTSSVVGIIGAAHAERMEAKARQEAYDLEMKQGDAAFEHRRYATALKWYADSYKKNKHTAYCAMYIGAILSRGLTGQKDPATAARYLADAVRLYRAEANKKSGGGAAFFLLSQLYLEGRGVAKDEQKAFKLMEEATTRKSFYTYLNSITGIFGPADAQYWIAYFYIQGIGVDRNYQKAFSIFTYMANENLSPAGAFGLGIMYYYGLGLPKDLKKAVSNFRKAAKEGNSDALAMIKKLLESGGLSRSTANELRACYAEKLSKKFVSRLTHPTFGVFLKLD